MCPPSCLGARAEKTEIIPHSALQRLRLAVTITITKSKLQIDALRKAYVENNDNRGCVEKDPLFSFSIFSAAGMIVRSYQTYVSRSLVCLFLVCLLFCVLLPPLFLKEMSMVIPPLPIPDAIGGNIHFTGAEARP